MRLYGQQIPLIGFLLVSKQWGYHKAGSSKTITYPLAMTATLSITLASINNGSAMLSIKQDSVDGKKFDLWFHNSNEYNFTARWMALGI